MSNVHATMPSPTGDLTLIASGNGLVAILWERSNGRHDALDRGTRDDTHPLLLAAKRQLAEYFAGARTAFDLTLDPAGTPFQREVWRALEAIPFGETRSYADVARAVGRPTAFRAVGAANGQNPLPIVVPCHRVIGAGGALTGFGGGMANKRLLLDLERRDPRLPLA